MSYESEVLADSPVAYWRLGEPSGATADDEIGTADGSYSGGPTYGAVGAVVGGNTAVSFDGTDDRVSIAGNAALNIGNVFSVEFWIKRNRDSFGGFETIYAGGNVASHINIRFGTAGNTNRVTLRAVSIGDCVMATVDILNDGLFHHVVVTKNGATSANIYIDAVDRSGTVTDRTFATLASEQGSIGGSNLPDAYTSAVIDEVAVYGTPLSSARVTAHYDAATAPGVVPVPRIATAIGANVNSR